MPPTWYPAQILALQMNFWPVIRAKIDMHGYLTSGVTSNDTMSLALRCNAKTYSMVVSATHLISCLNFSITDELLTNLWGKIGMQGYMTSRITSRGSMTLAPRCNAETYLMLISVTHLISCPNISIAYDLLAYLWGIIGPQGYLSSGLTLWGTMTLATRSN